MSEIVKNYFNNTNKLFGLNNEFGLIGVLCPTGIEGKSIGGLVHIPYNGELISYNAKSNRYDRTRTGNNFKCERNVFGKAHVYGVFLSPELIVSGGDLFINNTGRHVMLSDLNKITSDKFVSISGFGRLYHKLVGKRKLNNLRVLHVCSKGNAESIDDLDTLMIIHYTDINHPKIIVLNDNNSVAKEVEMPNEITVDYIGGLVWAS